MEDIKDETLPLCSVCNPRAEIGSVEKYWGVFLVS